MLQIKQKSSFIILEMQMSDFGASSFWKLLRTETLQTGVSLAGTVCRFERTGLSGTWPLTRSYLGLSSLTCSFVSSRWRCVCLCWICSEQ